MGRTRQHASASDRAAAALERLQAAGGQRKTFALSQRSIENIETLRGPDTATGLITRLLEEERARRADTP